MKATKYLQVSSVIILLIICLSSCNFIECSEYGDPNTPIFAFTIIDSITGENLFMNGKYSLEDINFKEESMWDYDFHSFNNKGDSLLFLSYDVFPKDYNVIIEFKDNDFDTLNFTCITEKGECYNIYYYDLTINNKKIYEKCQVNTDLYYFKK